MKTDTKKICGKDCTIYTDNDPKYLFIQPVDKHESDMLVSEIGHIKAICDIPFAFAAFEISDWNSELSLWEAPPVFGNEPFGSGAGETLSYIENDLIPKICEILHLEKNIPAVLGGYSLAGLFALWAGYASDRFSAIAAASPSVWFPKWRDFIGKHSPAVNKIYLSLGKKEEKTRNKVMASVGENILRQYEIMKSAGLDVTLEWNEGNHFTEPEIRTAKGFAWCILP